MKDYQISIHELLDTIKTAEFDTESYGEEAKRGFDNAMNRMCIHLCQELFKKMAEDNDGVPNSQR